MSAQLQGESSYPAAARRMHQQAHLQQPEQRHMRWPQTQPYNQQIGLQQHNWCIQPNVVLPCHPGGSFSTQRQLQQQTMPLQQPFMRPVMQPMLRQQAKQPPPPPGVPPTLRRSASLTGQSEHVHGLGGRRRGRGQLQEPRTTTSGESSVRVVVSLRAVCGLDWLIAREGL